MSIEIGFDNLKDAIAYEFFMNNISNFFFPEQEIETRSGEEIVETVALLAQCSYHVAEVFVKTQEQYHLNKKQKEDGITN